MRVLQALDRFFVRIEFVLLILFLSIMILLAFVQVVLRNFFDTGILWVDPLVRHLVIWVGFAGAAIATSEERHISIDAFTKFISPFWKSLVAAAASLFSVVVCYYLARAALTFFQDEMEYGGTVVLSVPSWVLVLILPAGYALMGFHFGVKTVDHLAAAVGKPKTARH